MIDELHRKGITTENLNAIDGSITDIGVSDAGLFDLSFIDGEHTDEACFRDFIWTFPMMKLDFIMAFHDSSLIYKSQKLILIYLDKMKVAYTFFKRADSEVSALVFGKYRAANLEDYLGPMEDQTVFFATSEARESRINSSIERGHALQCRKYSAGGFRLQSKSLRPGSARFDDWASRSQICRSALAGSKGQSPIFDPFSLGNGAGVVGPQTLTWLYAGRAGHLRRSDATRP